MTGTPDTPSRVGISVADIATGHVRCISGILAALLRRARTGEAPRSKIAMLDALTEWMSTRCIAARMAGAEPTRTTTNHPSVAPYGAHRTGDGGR